MSSQGSLIFDPADRRHALVDAAEISLEGLDEDERYWLFCHAPMATDLKDPVRDHRGTRAMRDEYNQEEPACQVLPHAWIMASKHAAWSKDFLRDNGSISTES